MSAEREIASATINNSENNSNTNNYISNNRLTNCSISTMFREKMTFCVGILLLLVSAQSPVVSAKSESYRCHQPGPVQGDGKCDDQSSSAVDAYFYDKHKKSCVVFTYLGCHGNDNRFATKNECEEVCVRTKVVIRVPDLKPGHCVAFPATPVRTPWGYCTHMCTHYDDNSCPGEQKCCFNGCGFQCVHPRTNGWTEKQGFCPSVAAVATTSAAAGSRISCMSDNSCVGNQKCCDSGSGFKICVNPKAEKDDQLDASTTTMGDSTNWGTASSIASTLASTTVPMTSSSSSSMPTSTSTAEVEGTIVCPIVVGRRCQQASYYELCQSDADCVGVQSGKCCFDGCGRVCAEGYFIPRPVITSSPTASTGSSSTTRVNPSSTNGMITTRPTATTSRASSIVPSSLPTTVSSPITSPSSPPTTTTQGTGTRNDLGGLSPFKVFGWCPYPPKCETSELFIHCVNDNQCPFKEKCCFTGCGYECAAPHLPDFLTGGSTTAATTPASATPSTASTPSAPTTTGGGNAAITTAAQPAITTRRSTASSPSSSSFSTTSSPVAAVTTSPSAAATTTASGDSMKSPIKAGFCSTVKKDRCLSHGGPPTGATYFYLACKDDTHCFGDLKCCFDGCGYQCQSPEKQSASSGDLTGDKEGTCPYASVSNAPVVLCRTDKDCAGRQKCCTTSGGRECLDAVGILKPPIQNPGGNMEMGELALQTVDPDYARLGAIGAWNMAHSFCRMNAGNEGGVGGIIYLYDYPLTRSSPSTSFWSSYSRVFLRDLPVGPNTFIGKRTPFRLELLDTTVDDAVAGCRMAPSLKTKALIDGVIGSVNADHVGNVDAATPPLFDDIALLPSYTGNKRTYVGDRLIAVTVPGSRQRLGCCKITECNHPCCQGPVAERCQAHVPRWYYNHVSGKCYKFFFGGCNPQKNNFKTQAECMKKCKGYKKE